MYFSGLKQRDYLILISILLLLIIYSIWQFYPEIFRHNNDLAMIRYFDPLEFSIFNGVWASYKHPFQYPIISGTIYPMLYYKLVSTMTFPIMYVKGDSIRILNNAVRLGGLASMIALFMVIALYSRQIFRSFLPGIITILLILSGGTNKGTIFGFFMSFRPNPFEFLMLFLAFYSLSIYFMNKSVKYLFYGIIFSSLCFSTKMDGIFLFPIISYLLYHSIINGEINFIKARKTFRYISNLFSILLFCTIPILTFSAYYFLFKRINEVTAHTVYETAGSVFVYKVAAFVILFSIIFLIAGIFIILLEKNMQKRVSSTLTINKGFMNFYILINSIITICAVYAGVFVLSNPY
ncbi:MAG: hypothetical protein HQK93_08920, partial [Nitrospirae bacterium]|nr:hypothetical protein [Nitrospirota bacterium]